MHKINRQVNQKIIVNSWKWRSRKKKNDDDYLKQWYYKWDLKNRVDIYVKWSDIYLWIIRIENIEKWPIY